MKSVRRKATSLSIGLGVIVTATIAAGVAYAAASTITTSDAAAASAGSASIRLKAPSSIPVGKHFKITVSGTSPTRKEFVGVVFTTKSCPANWDAIRLHNSGPGQIIPFPGAYNDGAIKVPKGGYSITSKRLHFSIKLKGKLCGLLFSHTNAPPQAHTSKRIKST